MTNYYEVSEESKIESVAVYARKSRAEEGEKDLENHLIRLKGRCEVNEWNYEIYKEIGSGSTLDDRPKMMELLEEIKTGRFDAVVVVDIDRLSRGKGADLDRILGIFRNNNVKIVQESPYEVYDLTNSNHAQMLEMKMFFGNMELAQTKKRFKEGKRLGLHLGKWMFGQSPFGYDIDKKTKKLVINQEEASILREMYDLYVNQDYNTVDTAWFLNSKGYTTRDGNVFHSKSITRLLQNETYTGTLVYNKSEGTHKVKEGLYSSGLPFRRLPKSEWKRKYNVHPAIFTMEEHKAVLDKIKKSPYISSGKRTISPLTDLCFTPEGEKYTVGNYNRKTGTPYNIQIQREKYEEKSEYRRVSIALIQNLILESIKALEERLVTMLEDNNHEMEAKQLHTKSKKLQQEIKRMENEIDKIQEGFIAGLFDAMEAKHLKKKRNEDLLKLEQELLEVSNKIDKVSDSSNLNRKDRIKEVYDKIISTDSPEEVNKLYKSIIKSIIVSRKSRDEIDIKINFL